MMFSDCESLTSVTIPPSVSLIEAHSFSDCSSLKHIVIPDAASDNPKYGYENLTDDEYGDPFEGCTILQATARSVGMSIKEYFRASYQEKLKEERIQSRVNLLTCLKVNQKMEESRESKKRELYNLYSYGVMVTYGGMVMKDDSGGDIDNGSSSSASSDGDTSSVGDGGGDTSSDNGSSSDGSSTNNNAMIEGLSNEMSPIVMFIRRENVEREEALRREFEIKLEVIRREFEAREKANNKRIEMLELENVLVNQRVDRGGERIDRVTNSMKMNIKVYDVVEV